MLYALFRIIFWAIVFLTVYSFCIRTKRVVNKRRFGVLTLVLCAVLCSVTGLIPVENLIISFESPEDVLRYSRTGIVGDIEYIAHGNDSSILIYSTADTQSIRGHFIVPRSSSGYKIPTPFSVRRVMQSYGSSTSIRVFNFDIFSVEGTDDYYIVGFFFTPNDTNIVDNNGNVIKQISTWNETLNEYIIYVFSYIENFGNEYYLLINGEKLTIG